MEDDPMLLEAKLSTTHSSKGKEPAISWSVNNEIALETLRKRMDGDPESPERPKTGREMTAEMYQALRAKSGKPLARILGPHRDETRKAMVSEQVTSATNQTALHVAAMYGHEEVVREVLRFGTDRNLLTAVDYMGYTPLHAAAKCGRSTVVEILINHAESVWPASGSQDDAQQVTNLLRMEVEYPRVGLTALDLAAMSGHLEVVKVFTNKHKNLLWAKDKGSTLYHATICNQWNVVFHILSFEEAKEHSLRVKNSGPSPLHKALYARREDIALELMKMVPEYITRADNDGNTPLHLASILGMLKSVCLLLEFNPSVVYIRNKTKGAFPIHRAARGGHIHVYKELLHHCPDLEIAYQNDDGMTVLHLGVLHERFNFVRYILETTQSDDLINARDNYGNTALHLAIENDSIWLIFLLLDDKRIDVRIRNGDGRLPKDIITSKMEILWGTPFSQKAAIYSAVMEAHGFDFHPDSLSTRISDHQRSIPGPEVESKWRSTADNLLVAATLIATVSFASIFTLPGQYESSGSDQGLAHFRRLTLLKFFIVVDSLALFSSIITAILVIVATWTDTLGLVFVVPFALNMAALSFIAMCAAFILALILMINHLSWELILVSSTGLILVMILLLIFLGYTSPARVYWRVCVVLRRILRLATPKSPGSKLFRFSPRVKQWRIWSCLILVMILLVIFLGYTSPARVYWRVSVALRRILRLATPKSPGSKLFRFSPG